MDGPELIERSAPCIAEGYLRLVLNTHGWLLRIKRAGCSLLEVLPLSYIPCFSASSRRNDIQRYVILVSFVPYHRDYRYAAVYISSTGTMESRQHRDRLSGALDYHWAATMRHQYVRMAREHTQSIPYLGRYCQFISHCGTHCYRWLRAIHSISSVASREGQDRIHYQERGLCHLFQ
jgi:hypothetical protein